MLLHRGVVGNTVLHGLGKPTTNPGDSPANSFDPADDRLSSKVGFQDITEDAGLARGVVELAAEFVDLAGELVRTTGRVLELTLTGACRSGELVDLSSVLGKFALHVVERGGGVVELDPPILGARI